MNQSWINLSSWLLLGGFMGYAVATFLFITGAVGSRMKQGVRFAWAARLAPHVHLAGVALHFAAILARWQGIGHWPTSNMYEFIGFLAFASQLAYQVMHRIFAMPSLGGVVAPIGVTLMAYSYVFPPKAMPLIAPLKSYWLPLHVSTVAISEGFFAVAFGTAVLYLLRMRGLELAAEASRSEVAAAAAPGTVAGPDFAVPAASDAKERLWSQRGFEVMAFTVLVFVGWTLLALILRWSGYQWNFVNAIYHLPPIIGPAGSPIGLQGDLLGFIPLPLVVAPTWLKGKNWNTLLYALAIGALLYRMVRAVLREPIGDFFARRVRGDLEALDEVSYRTVAIGYPLFTLGGLIFAMFWAADAWGRYWFFDPKETWALITWLVYSAYLHLRMTKGWEGRKSAWIAVIGFGVVMFTTIGVNLLLVGLHSYAGGD